MVLAIYLVTSSKGGISAMELKRSLLAGWRRGRDLRRRPGPAGRGGAGKVKVDGAVESDRGRGRGRRLGRLSVAAGCAWER